MQAGIPGEDPQLQAEHSLDPEQPALVQARLEELSANAALIAAVCQPRESTCTAQSYALFEPAEFQEIHRADTYPVARRPPTNAASVSLGPVPTPALSAAVEAWLSAHAIDSSALETGEVLLAAAAEPPAPALRRRLRNFKAIAPSLQLCDADLPDESDLRLQRCWPRVLCSVAKAAEKTDPSGWATACADHLTIPTPSWIKCTLNEAWEGDALCREMLRVHGSPTCTVLVAGSQGAGKSATIGRLLGRKALPHSHALSFCPSIPSSRARQEQLRKYRHIDAVSWPHHPLELDIPYPSFEVCRAYVKLDGKLLSFVELPSMEAPTESADEAARLIVHPLGEFEKIVADVQRDRPDYVLLVERMDGVDERRLRGVVRRLQRLYGRQVLQRAIVVLTHGQALPPADMGYEVWKFDRVRAVREVLGLALGDRGESELPIIVFENSENCTIDPSSRKPLLPDGSDFLQQFQEEFCGLVQRISSVATLAPIPTKRWWENLVLVAGVAFLINKVT